MSGGPLLDRLSWWMTDVASSLLAPDEREAVRGDLAEAGTPGIEALGEVLGLVIRRQAALWMDWRPWLALFTIVIPLGIVISHVSRWWADGAAIYAFLYVNHWYPALLDSPGSRSRIVDIGSGVLLQGAALIGWSWLTGFVLGALSPRTLWVTATLFCLVVLGATVGTTTMARANSFNAEVFVLAFYRVVFPQLLRMVLVLLPAFWGMRRGRRRPALPWLATVCATAAMAFLTVSVSHAVGSAMTLGRIAVQKTPSTPDTARSAPATAPAPTVGTAAPDFTLHDANGATVKLSDYKGKVVLLDFWATWCGGCKLEIPWYVEFDKTYRDHGLVSIGVAMDDEGWQTVTPYLAQHAIPYAIVVSDAEIIRQYGVTSLPVTLLIDRDGRIADSHVGVVVKETWEAEIKKLIAQPPTLAPAAP